jgi:hypothetical protein
MDDYHLFIERDHLQYGWGGTLVDATGAILVRQGLVKNRRDEIRPRPDDSPRE